MDHIVRRWTLPDSYMGATWEDYYSSGFGQSRDSSSLERSNFEIAYRELSKLRCHVPDETDTDEETSSVDIVRENHWAVGWVEWIAIHKFNIQAYQRALLLADKANDYPVLDEDHWSSLEYTQACEFWSHCSIKERVSMCREYGDSIFSARNDSPPENVFDHIRE